MDSIARILVVVDPTAGGELNNQRAVERGLLLAKRGDAELRLLIVCDYNQYLADLRFVDVPSLEHAHAQFTTRQRAALEQLANAVRARGVRASIDLVWDRPLHEGITRATLRYKPDVVLKDTHHHPALLRTLFTNTDWHLIRECPAPLLLVRGDAWPEAPKVLTAVDPLHERDKPAALDRKLLDVAAFYAQAMRGELHVVHACEPISSIAALDGTYVPVPVPLPVDELNEKLRARHAGALRDLTAECAVPGERVHLCEGSVCDEIRNMARSLPASLVVMGAIARSAMQRMFIGSTAERVLESLPCDVLIVKPDGFHSPVELSGQKTLVPEG
jgi:universal stress protein E